VRRFRGLMKFAFSAALIAILIWKYPISWVSVVGTFHQVRPLFNQFVLSSIKWQLILRTHDIHIRLPSLVRSYMIGNFFSAFLPSSYMGDFVRIADVGRASGRAFESASAVVLERLSGLAALAATGTLASYYITARYEEPAFKTLALLFLLIAILLVSVFVPGVLRLMRSVISRIPVGTVRRLFDKVSGVVQHYRSRPRLLLQVLFWSFAFQLMAYTIFYLYGQAIGLDVPYLYCYAFVPVVYLLEALPISVAGIGLREGGLIYFLSKVGYTSSEAIALSIVVVSCRYTMNLTGGLLFLTRRGGLKKAVKETPLSDPLPVSAGSSNPRGASAVVRLKRTLVRQILPGFVASLYYYFRFRCIVHPRAGMQLSPNIQIGRKTTIHKYSRIIIGDDGKLSVGSECNLQSFSAIAVGNGDVRIGDHVRIGPNCNLLGEDHQFDRRDIPVHKQPRKPSGLVIGDDVFIGGNSVVLAGIRVGCGAVIGAGSVVTGDVPEYAVVVGNPAQVRKYRGVETSELPAPEPRPTDQLAS
jgi:uncharacterized protein (TIRG00374 family)